MNNGIQSPAFDLLDQLHMNLEGSKTAYSEYLEGGKTLLYAKILKVYNSKVRELLLEKGHLLTSELQKDAVQLIAHYDVWLQKWNDHYDQLNPGPDDIFVFPNTVTFPRQAATNIEHEYQRLLNQMIHAN